MGPRGELPTAPVTYFCLSPRKNNNGTTARWLYTRYTNWTLGWSFTWRWEILASISINIIIHLVNGHSRILNWGYLPYIRPIKGLYKAYVGDYPHKIWPYMVQYLHFRILEFPLIWQFQWSCHKSNMTTMTTTSRIELNSPSIQKWSLCWALISVAPPQQFFKIANLSKDFN